MKVLVVYASRHGSTAGIAERIGAGLRAAGLAADVQSVAEVRNVAPYDAFVIGSAAYMFHWLKEARSFVKRHRSVLAQRPTWLFSSGPLGTDLVDEHGRDIFEATRPKEFEQLASLLQPRGERVFFGAWDPDAPAIGFAERMLQRSSGPKTALPAGDFRDWPAIDAWTAEIAEALHELPDGRLSGPCVSRRSPPPPPRRAIADRAARRRRPWSTPGARARTPRRGPDRPPRRRRRR